MVASELGKAEGDAIREGEKPKSLEQWPRILCRKQILRHIGLATLAISTVRTRLMSGGDAATRERLTQDS